MTRTNRQQAIATYIKDHPGYTHEAIAEALKIPRALVTREAGLLGGRTEASLRDLIAQKREEVNGIYSEMLEISRPSIKAMRVDPETGEEYEKIDWTAYKCTLETLRDIRTLNGLDMPKVTQVEAQVSVSGEIAHLDRHAPDVLLKAEQVIARILESGVEEVQDAEIAGLLDVGGSVGTLEECQEKDS